MHFDLTILGCNSAIPAHGRFPTSQVLNVSDQLYMIDCGEGAQWRLQETGIKRGKINQIFISHLHGDHIYGLIGLLNSYSLSKREEPITVFSPNGLEEIIRVQLKYTKAELSFPLFFIDVDTTEHQLIFEDSFVEVYSIPLTHRAPTSGFLFREKPRPLNIIASKIEEFNIPIQKIKEIKSGADFTLPNGTILSNSELTLPPIPSRSYAFCSDTLYDESIVSLIHGVDLLYHESTFLHELKPMAQETMHSTAKEAATIAKKANVGQLVLGHYSSRYKELNPLLDEAIQVFPNTVLGLDGKVIAVPLRKRKRV